MVWRRLRWTWPRALLHAGLSLALWLAVLALRAVHDQRIALLEVWPDGSFHAEHGATAGYCRWCNY
jgi:hypothetical protein